MSPASANSEEAIYNDVAAIASLSPVSAILELICKATGMGFAAVARVTDERWIACTVRDEINFGLMPLGELKLDTTICHEIRQSGQPVVIDHVTKDEYYHDHHTPAMYGFQSYISVPIRLQDGSFWGTLCAIDPTPAMLNTPQMISLFKAFTRLISFLMDAASTEPKTFRQLVDARTIAAIQEEMDSFTATVVAGRQSPGQRLANNGTPAHNEKLQHATESILLLLQELQGMA